jgi:hypothetical protein
MSELLEQVRKSLKSAIGAVIEKSRISHREDVSAADRKRTVAEYGKVTYADAKNKKYPIDTPEHVAAAARYFGKGKNRAKYSAEEAALIDKRIRRAEKKHGIGAGAEED